MRKYAGEKLLIATHNQGKAHEIAGLLGAHISTYSTAADYDLVEPEETGTTFQENAILKARAAAKASGQVSLADDSGLSVYALGGAPGIYSARWGGPEKDFNKAMLRVQSELGDNPDRGAEFVCVLAVAWPDGHAQTYEGRIRGQLIWPPRGEKGFGYDPIFIPEGKNKTFAEIDGEEKQNISHRARAFSALVQDFFER